MRELLWTCTSILVVCCVVGGEISKCETKLNTLDNKLRSITLQNEALSRRLREVEQSKLAGRPFSIVGAFTETKNLAGNVVTHVLSLTDLDEQITRAVLVARDNIMNTSIPAQSFEAVSEFAQPYRKNYPFINTMITFVYSAGANTVWVARTLTPWLWFSADFVCHQTYNLLWYFEVISNLLGTYILDPIFLNLAAASPDHQTSLPQNTVDRILLIALIIFIMGKCVNMLWKALGWSRLGIIKTVKCIIASQRALYQKLKEGIIASFGGRSRSQPQEDATTTATKAAKTSRKRNEKAKKTNGQRVPSSQKE